MPSSVSLIDFVRNNLNSDVRDLMLQAQRYPDVDMRKAVVQISAWHITMVSAANGMMLIATNG